MMTQCPRAVTGLSGFLADINWRNNHTCSYCGSMSPERFFELVEKGVKVGPTDKNYKAYIADPAPGGGMKMYFQHFDEDDKKRFTDLVNDGKMKIGVPGHFYTRPFFMKEMTAMDMMANAVKGDHENLS